MCVFWAGDLVVGNKHIVLYCIVLYCIVLYCIVLYCIVFRKHTLFMVQTSLNIRDTEITFILHVGHL